MPKKKATEEKEIEVTEEEEMPDGFIPLVQPEESTEEVVEEPQVEETVVEESVVEETPEEEPETAEEKPVERPTFKFADDESKSDKQPFMVIKHLGKEIPIDTEDEARNFIQKGFDYDFKVGRHGKLAKTLEQHPDFEKIVAQAWQDYERGVTPTKPETKPSKPELKSLEEYEKPEDWFWDNYSKVREFEKTSEPPPRPMVQPQPKTDGDALAYALVGHDPQNVSRIAPMVPQYAEKYLTKEQYDRVNSDLPSLIQFYDWVKNQIQVEKEPIKPEKQISKVKPSFRVKSGGGETPDTTSKPPWEGNNEEFERYMAKIKGLDTY